MQGTLERRASRHARRVLRPYLVARLGQGRGLPVLGVAIMLTLALWGAAPALAQSNQAQSYQVVSYTIDGGGGRAQSSSYALRGVTGQPDAGIHLGGGYRLYGGFLTPLRVAVDPGAPSVFLPTLNRGP